MLIEVLLSMALAVLLVGGFTAWGAISLTQQDAVKAANDDTFGLGLGSVNFPQDVASSMAGVSEVDENGSPRPAGALRDCTGGEAAGGDVLVALITPSHRRITYVLVPSSEDPSLMELWRRECPNLSETGDGTLNDPTLSAAGSLNPGVIDPGTAGNDGSAERMATGIVDGAADCPRDGGGGQDPGCRTISLTAEVVDRPQDVVTKGTRRVNSYAPPGTEPIPRFVFTPNPPERNETVTFDASSSNDPVGGTLTYSWDFGDGTTSNSGPTVTHSYASLGTYTVSLHVTNSAGTTSSSPAIRTVTVEPKPPTAVFLGVPLQAIENASKNFALSLTAHETTLDTYSLDWGDGTSSGPLGSCVGTAAGTPCTPTEVHTYTTKGTYIVRLTVTDAGGNSRSALASVTVGNGTLYVSSSGSDTPGCGSSGAPCRQIEKGLTEAESNGLTRVVVTGGSFSRFDVRNGITVEGGFTADFQTQGETTTVNAALKDGRYSAMQADNISTSTLVSNLELGGPSTSTDAAQAVIVRNGTSGLSLSELHVNGGSGPHATGILVEGGSTLPIDNSAIESGTTTGTSGTPARGNSAYGIRVVGGSNVTVTGGSISASAGVSSPSSGGSKPPKASGGTNGKHGGNACGPSCPGGGGAQVNSGVRRGGQGGSGGNYSGGGQWGASGGGGAGGGRGGCGSIFGCGTNAGGGGGGAAGGAGSRGAAASNLAPAGSLWVPTLGGAGGNGSDGAGGGGGGGGKSASASGGGGGGGGGGGAGGQGQSAVGRSGGGSFGVYANDSSVSLTNVTVTASTGGTGSNGAPGGDGGNGGNGGYGRNKSCCSAGGGGGGGGGGGAGGGGGSGGGAGGPSVAVYHRGSGALWVVGGSQTRASSAANGGWGGASGVGGSGGQQGQGVQGGGWGGNGATSTQTSPGHNGPSGFLARIWDNGSVTS